MSDPLVALRTAIASKVSPELLSKNGEVLADADLSKATSLRIPAAGDGEAQTFPLTELTKYESKVPNKMQLDLRVVYNCWLTRDLNVTDYIQVSDERGIFNLKFVERADLLGWLKGENEESKNILSDKAGRVDEGSDGKAANKAIDESKPTKKTVSFDDSSSAELKLIYDRERSLQNHNSVLRGSKPIDFSTVSKECQKSIIQAFKTKQLSSARSKKPEPHGAVSKGSSNGSQKGTYYFSLKFRVLLFFQC
jgi:parafibromin